MVSRSMHQAVLVGTCLALAAATVLSAPLAQGQTSMRQASDSTRPEAEMRQLAVQYTLAKRWAQLFVDVLGEFQRDRRDAVDQIQADFSTRIIAIRTTRRDQETWVKQTLTESELASGDLARIAKRLYAKSTGALPDSTRRPSDR